MKEKTKKQNNHLPHYNRRLTGYTASVVSFGAQALLIGYLTFYLTDSVLMSAGLVGGIIGISRVFDGISDIIAGVIINKTNTRWGKARPYALCIPLMWVAVVLLFTVPEISTTGKVIYVFLMYNLSDTVFRTLTTTAGPVYAKRAFNSDEQLDIVGVSGLVAGLVNMVIAVVMPLLINAFGDTKEGWTIIALAFAVPGGVMGLMQFFMVPEIITDTDEEKTQKLSTWDAVKILFSNKYIFLFFVAGLFRSIISGMTMGTYYFTYIVGNLDLLSVCSIAGIISMVIMPLIPMITRKLGLRKFVVVFLVVGVVGYFMVYLAPTNLIVLSISSALALLSGLPISMLGNLVAVQCMKYTEWKDGVAVDGLIGSMNSLSMKLGTALGAIIVGACLAAVGYDGALAVQSAAANSMITFLYAGLPGLLTAGATVAMYFYRLEDKMPQIEAELETRKTGATK